MAAGQSLRGFVAQGLDGQKKSVTPYAGSYPTGTHTLTITKGGSYRFVLRGHGGGAGNASANAGGSGAFLSAIRTLGAGQIVTITVPAPPDAQGTAPTATTVTLPSGEVLSAGGGSGGSAGGAGGTATANANFGDVAINGTTGGVGAVTGTAGGGAGGGAGGVTDGVRAGGTGAPGTLEFKGAAGPNTNTRATAIGAGAASSGAATYDTPGGAASVTVVQVRMRR